MSALIGCTGRRMPAAELAGVPRPLLAADVDIHFADYGEKLLASGATPVLLPRDASPAVLAERLDGIVLTGGADIDPRRYGATPGPNHPAYEPERDRFEIELYGAARDAGLPVLGICRGLQIINVAHGGTLVADLPPDEGEGHSSYAYPRAHRSHGITVEPGTVLADLYGESVVVNSFHHQSVDELGRDLVVSARAADGVIEALELPGSAVLAVQWHPEMFDDVVEPVFGWLVKHAKQRT